MWKYVKMFRLNRIPSGIWPMLTNSRLLQIGMQPTVAILFSQCTSKGNHTKDSWYQCNHQWLLWRFGLRYVVFVVQLNREKQYPKVDISAVPTSKKWDCCSYESFFKKNNTHDVDISMVLYNKIRMDLLQSFGLGDGPLVRVLSIPPGSIPKHWPRQVECSQYRSLWPFLRFTTLSAFIVI